MKKILSLASLLLVGATACYAQIGINTANPQGSFHVDGIKNNPVSGVPTAIQQKDDFVVTDQGKVGIGTTTPNASAVLDVSSSDKGVLLPKVSLTSTTDQVTIATPATGLLAYNTATAGVAPYDVSPGYYYWDGAKWAKMSSSTSNPSWAIGEERAYVGTSAYTNWTTAGSSKIYMIGKNVANTSPHTSKLLSEAEGNTSGYLTVNGLRMDFWYPNHRPVFVNTTSTPITYSLVTWSTANQYTNGTKTVIAASAISFAVDGDNAFSLTNNDAAEAVHGYIAFSTGEWYHFSFYLILIDNIVKGYTTARRIL